MSLNIELRNGFFVAEDLRAQVDIDIDPDGAFANITITNTSPEDEVENPDPLIFRFCFNLAGFTRADFDVDVPDGWEFRPPPETPSGLRRCGACGLFQYSLTADPDERLSRNESVTFRLISLDPENQPFSEETFTEAPLSTSGGAGEFQLAVFFQQVGPEGEGSACVGGFYDQEPPPPPPVPKKCIANPQTCCQVVIKHQTQLVPPALIGTGFSEVTHTKTVRAAIEAVCPEKVIICGVVRKKIIYDALVTDKKTGEQSVVEGYVLHDEIPFQCYIDRDDANEGDQYEITGAEVLCDVYAYPDNNGKASLPVVDEAGNTTGTMMVKTAWSYKEKEILKICIRKVRRAPKAY